MMTNESYHRKGPKSNWTAATVEQAAQLWEAGMSAAEIAAVLPGSFSRNSVIGKLHRLGMMNKIADKPPPKPRPRPASARRLPTVAPLTPRPLVQAPPAPPRPKPSGKLTLIGLDESTCKWPIGEVGAEGFHFCGAPKVRDVGVPYCPYHGAKSRGRQQA